MATGDIEVRLAVLERILPDVEQRLYTQLGRIISDIESEKGTRQRLHEDWRRDMEILQTRVRSLEKHMSIGIGILAAVQVLVPLASKLLK